MLLFLNLSFIFCEDVLSFLYYIIFFSLPSCLLIIPLLSNHLLCFSSYPWALVAHRFISHLFIYYRELYSPNFRLFGRWQDLLSSNRILISVLLVKTIDRIPMAYQFPVISAPSSIVGDDIVRQYHMMFHNPTWHQAYLGCLEIERRAQEELDRGTREIREILKQQSCEREPYTQSGFVQLADLIQPVANSPKLQVAGSAKGLTAGII